MSLSPGTHQPIMGDNPKLQQLQLEIDDVTKQIMKVLANSSSVEAAIAGNGTYRGYSGEDVFLKHNLWAVQKEMMKQLRRQQRKLEKQKAQLLQQVSPVPPAVGGEDPFKWDVFCAPCDLPSVIPYVPSPEKHPTPNTSPTQQPNGVRYWRRLPKSPPSPRW